VKVAEGKTPLLWKSPVTIEPRLNVIIQQSPLFVLPGNRLGQLEKSCGKSFNSDPVPSAPPAD
jgi:hypothetical protein